MSTLRNKKLTRSLKQKELFLEQNRVVSLDDLQNFKNIIEKLSRDSNRLLLVYQSKYKKCEEIYKNKICKLELQIEQKDCIIENLRHEINLLRDNYREAGVSRSENERVDKVFIVREDNSIEFVKLPNKNCKVLTWCDLNDCDVYVSLCINEAQHFRRFVIIYDKKINFICKIYADQFEERILKLFKKQCCKNE
ncbi:hypothetical protein [Urbanus proteus nucleopolyhedrovirus]|uniref:Uncharacterized protein n=1 Tax=Urbanus proteus nucleopolyhedrovirus TaxID=1675866 RepID=A0A162GV46_9ABAC|nr:hypothetical protein [Urbanus proteus nucleopolyhedrovirus]AKR17394.1 hypothetical protein [Urbanus proteus nucleopolyhedrovirus]